MNQDMGRDIVDLCMLTCLGNRSLQYTLVCNSEVCQYNFQHMCKLVLYLLLDIESLVHTVMGCMDFSPILLLLQIK